MWCFFILLSCCAAVLSDSLSHEAATADQQTLQERAQWLLEAFTQLDSPSKHITDEDFLEVYYRLAAAGAVVVVLSIALFCRVFFKCRYSLLLLLWLFASMVVLVC